MWNESSLQNKRVLVTAGTDGIGLAITRAFIDAGALVFVCDIQEVGIARLTTELPTVHSCLADVSSEEAVSTMYEMIDRQFGGLDVLVNNAGIAGPTGGVETLSLSDWERTIAVNLTGQFLCARLAVPRLRQGNNPAIINITSAAGRLGMPGRSPYSASKAAVIGFTKSLALELGNDGIRVNAIAPGAVDGPRIRAVIAAKANSSGKTIEDVERAYTSQAALGRMVTDQDIANMVLFAASDLAANITGQTLAVDGMTQALS